MHAGFTPLLDGGADLEQETHAGAPLAGEFQHLVVQFPVVLWRNLVFQRNFLEPAVPELVPKGMRAGLEEAFQCGQHTRSGMLHEQLAAQVEELVDAKAVAPGKGRQNQVEVCSR